MEEISSIPGYLLRNSKIWGDRVAMRHKNLGLWQEYTWKDYYEIVKYISLGLIRLGLKKGDEAGIIGDAEPEWYWAEIAVSCAHGVPVGIYTDAHPPEVSHFLSHFHCEFVFSHDQEQVDKVLTIKDDLPLLKKAIYWDSKGLRKYDDPLLMSFRELRELGRQYDEENPGLFEEMIRGIKGDDICYIAPTSGTTGDYSKGAVHTHMNFIKGYESLSDTAPLDYTDRYLGFLPPTVIWEQLMVLSAGVIDGVVAYFPEEPETVKEDMRDVAPTSMLYAGTVWDSVASEVQARISEANVVVRSLFNLCMKIGEKRNLMIKEGLTGWFWEMAYRLANMAVLRPVRDNIGLLYVRHPFSSATMLSVESIKFFRSMGIHVRDAYGSMEMMVIVTQPPDSFKYGSVGKPLKGVEVKIEDSEILVRGPFLLTGYYNDPEKTKLALKDGWYHTGDAGTIDEEGYLIYIDRLSDLATLSTGEKYSPMFIESKLRFSPSIKTAMAVGQGYEYPAVIINMDFDFVGRWAEQHHVPYTTFADLSQKDEVANLMNNEIYKINRLLPEHSKIRKFMLLHKELDPDEAELTRTFKVRRKFISDRYKDLIEAFYNGRDGVNMESEVKYRDGRRAISTTFVRIRDVHL